MSAPKKRDSTILLLEKYGDKLRQFSRQQAHLEEQNKAASASPAAPTVTISKPVEVTPPKPEPVATAPKESVEAPAAVATAAPKTEVAPVTQTIEPPKESHQPALSEPVPAEPTQTVEKPKPEEAAPVLATAQGHPTETPEKKAVEEVTKPTELTVVPVEASTSVETPAENPIVAPEPTNSAPETQPTEAAYSVEAVKSTEEKAEAAPVAAVVAAPEPVQEETPAEIIHEPKPDPVQESRPTEVAETKTEPEADPKQEEASPVIQEAQLETPAKFSHTTTEENDSTPAPAETEPEQHSPEPEPDAAPAETTRPAHRTPGKRKKASKVVENQEPKKEEPAPAEVPPAADVSAAPSGRQLAITSEFFELRWYALLDRVEWTFGYSKLANHRMHLEWDLEDGLDNIQGQTDSLVLKEGEDYIDLNTKLRFSASILVKDLESMRFKPKIITFTLLSDVDNSIMGVFELDLRTIMATGKFDSELRFKLVDLETMKARSTSPTLVMILKRVKLESVSGEKPTKRSDVKEEKPAPEIVPEEDEEVVAEPQERRRERLRREQSTRRRVRKAAIEAEDGGAPDSPSSSSPSLSPETTPKKRRVFKIFRTNSRFETVEDVDK